MPTPNPGEDESDYVSRCIPIVSKEGTAKDNDQAVAMCHSMFKTKKNAESLLFNEIIYDQERKGKSRTEAEDIARYLAGELKELNENNLIMINKDFNVSLLPLKQKVFWQMLLKKWKDKKMYNEKFLQDWSLEDIENKIKELEQNDTISKQQT